MKYIVLEKVKYSSHYNGANVNYKIIDEKEFVDKYKDNPNATFNGVETDTEIVRAIRGNERYMLLLSGCGENYNVPKKNNQFQKYLYS